MPAAATTPSAIAAAIRLLANLGRVTTADLTVEILDAAATLATGSSQQTVLAEASLAVRAGHRPGGDAVAIVTGLVRWSARRLMPDALAAAIGHVVGTEHEMPLRRLLEEIAPQHPMLATLARLDAETAELGIGYRPVLLPAQAVSP